MSLLPPGEGSGVYPESKLLSVFAMLNGMAAADRWWGVACVGRAGIDFVGVVGGEGRLLPSGHGTRPCSQNTSPSTT